MSNTKPKSWRGKDSVIATASIDIEEYSHYDDPGSADLHRRTGTLIALWMMRAHGFTARAAMGWLRVMRPGSVIGQQQGFLCRVQRIREERAAAERAGLALPRAASSPSACGAPGPDGPRMRPPPLVAGGRSSSTAATAAGQVSSALDRQSAARIRAGRAGLQRCS